MSDDTDVTPLEHLGNERALAPSALVGGHAGDDLEPRRDSRSQLGAVLIASPMIRAALSG
jgi:hypothetical protein